MKHERHATYKGRKVVVWATEHVGVAKLPATFTSIYVIGDGRANRDNWQQVADPIFATGDTATAFGLVQAKLAIDAMPPAA